MKATKMGGLIDHQTFGRLEVVRKALLDGKFADRLEKPLAYWALPKDRQLPIALLGRTVGELVATPIEQLTGTPGIGVKKIRTFVTLLERATNDRPPEMLVADEVAGFHPNGNGHAVSKGSANGNGQIFNGHFDLANVSEATWELWCENVNKFGLGSETLGRLAPTLELIPTVLWQTPLKAYLNQSLEEIRALKTHGEKRVRGVLEVFHGVNQALAGQDPNGRLAVRLQPRFAVLIENWIAAPEGAHPFSLGELKQRLARPLVDQIELDAGNLISRFAAERIGLNGRPRSVREQAKEAGMTRARVYQLFDECENIMRVRWPNGPAQLNQLKEQMIRASASAAEIEFVESIQEFFFPTTKTDESRT